MKTDFNSEDELKSSKPSNTFLTEKYITSYFWTITNFETFNFRGKIPIVRMFWMWLFIIGKSIYIKEVIHLLNLKFYTSFIHILVPENAEKHNI